MPDSVGREIELNHLIKNHEEIVSLMAANIHFAQPDEELLHQIAAYVRYVAVYSALRSTKTYDLNPIDVGEPFPTELIASLESTTRWFAPTVDSPLPQKGPWLLTIALADGRIVPDSSNGPVAGRFLGNGVVVKCGRMGCD